MKKLISLILISLIICAALHLSFEGGRELQKQEAEVENLKQEAVDSIKQISRLR